MTLILVSFGTNVSSEFGNLTLTSDTSSIVDTEKTKASFLFLGGVTPTTSTPTSLERVRTQRAVLSVRTRRCLTAKRATATKMVLEAR